jgi:tetratricopeptide (TPR) repeat protein
MLGADLSDPAAAMPALGSTTADDTSHSVWPMPAPAVSPAQPARRLPIGRAWLSWVLLGVALLGVALLALGCGGSSPSSGGSAQDLLNRALKAHTEGKLDEAKRLYGEVLKDDRTNQFALYNLGLIAQTTGDNVTAERDYRLALETNPNFDAALFNLAILRTQAGASEEAMSLYRQVLTLTPQNAGANLNLGLLLLQTGLTDEGGRFVATAIQLDPSLASRIPTTAQPSSSATTTP